MLMEPAASIECIAIFQTFSLVSVTQSIRNKLRLGQWRVGAHKATTAVDNPQVSHVRRLNVAWPGAEQERRP